MNAPLKTFQKLHIRWFPCSFIHPLISLCNPTNLSTCWLLCLPVIHWLDACTVNCNLHFWDCHLYLKLSIHTFRLTWHGKSICHLEIVRQLNLNPEIMQLIKCTAALTIYTTMYHVIFIVYTHTTSGLPCLGTGTCIFAKLKVIKSVDMIYWKPEQKFKCANDITNTYIMYSFLMSPEQICHQEIQCVHTCAENLLLLGWSTFQLYILNF